MAPRRASTSDREHFRAVAAANTPLGDECLPSSLDEVFDRLEALRRRLGPAATPGVPGEDESELRAHLRFLERREELRRRGAKRA
jgi:hypothetical protein